MVILSEISTLDIISLSQTNKCIMDICQNNRVWKARLKQYFPHEYKEMAKQSNLAKTAYYEYFKACYDQPFYLLEEGREAKILITKSEHYKKWQACRKYYLWVMESNFQAITDYQQQATKSPICLPEMLIFERLLDDCIQNYRHKNVFDWAASAWNQPLLKMAFQESKANKSPANNEKIKSLLEDNNYNFDDKIIPQELLLALILNQLEVIDASSLKNNINQALTQNGCTALYIAARNGHQELVKYLLKHNASVDLADSDNTTPLYIAAENGHLQVVELLIKHHADVNKLRSDNNHMLSVTTQNGHLEVLEYLIGYAKDIKKTIQYLLLLAVKMGHLEIVKYLIIQHEADVNYPYTNVPYPLYVAAQEGHLPVVEYLITHGALIDAATSDGAFPLYVAAHAGWVDVVKYLIKKGANIEQTNTENLSSLYIAAQEGCIEVIKVLMQCNLDDASGRINHVSAALYQGVIRNIGVVITLIRLGADINKVCTIEGATPLHIAAQHGRFKTMQYLVEQGADINKRCIQESLTPLQVARANNHEVIADYLNNAAPQVQKIMHELTNICNTGGCVNARSLDKAIALYRWYAKQTNSNLKLATYIIKQLKVLANNNNSQLTPEKFTAIIKDSFDYTKNTHLVWSFWKPSHEDFKDCDAFKLVEKFLLEILENQPIELDFNAGATLTQ